SRADSSTSWRSTTIVKTNSESSVLPEESNTRNGEQDLDSHLSFNSNMAIESKFQKFINPDSDIDLLFDIKNINLKQLDPTPSAFAKFLSQHNPIPISHGLPTNNVDSKKPNGGSRFARFFDDDDDDSSPISKD